MARFRSLLKNQGMTDSQSQKDFNPVAQRVCEDAAAGTLQRPSSYFPSAQSPGYSSPPANASELALFDAIRVFCPQYMH